MKYKLHMVTGAPGAGKSTTVQAFMALKTDYIAFDIDWLAPAASDLAGKSIYFDPSTWKPYGELWNEVLYAICKNGKVPVFFTPTDPNDIAEHGPPAWCSEIKWLLLDCDDGIRRNRLSQRDGWTEARIAEALEDAHVLRELVERRLDTGKFSPDEVANRISKWLAK